MKHICKTTGYFGETINGAIIDHENKRVDYYPGQRIEVSHGDKVSPKTLDALLNAAKENGYLIISHKIKLKGQITSDGVKEDWIITITDSLTHKTEFMRFFGTLDAMKETLQKIAAEDVSQTPLYFHADGSCIIEGENNSFMIQNKCFDDKNCITYTAKRLSEITLSAKYNPTASCCYDIYVTPPNEEPYSVYVKLKSGDEDDAVEYAYKHGLLSCPNTDEYIESVTEITLDEYEHMLKTQEKHSQKSQTRTFKI